MEVMSFDRELKSKGKNPRQRDQWAPAVDMLGVQQEDSEMNDGYSKPEQKKGVSQL